jgi:Tol biopolymer transport system component
MLRAVVRNLVVPIGLAFLASAVRAGQFELLSKAGAVSDTALGLGSLPIDQQAPAVSADGRWIAFASAAVSLAAGQSDLNGAHDAFLLDRQTGTTVLVSHAAGSLTTAASGGSSQPTSISDDGRWVVYHSIADDLVPGQVVANTSAQVYLYDRDTGINTLVSHSTAGPAVNGNGQSFHPRISGDGNWISFESGAPDLIAGQNTGGSFNIFLYERATGQTILVSRAAGTTLTGGNQQSLDPVLSQDGRWVAFRSQATDLVAGFSNGNPSLSINTFLFDRVTGAMTLVSHASGSPTTGLGGWIPEISPDGAAVLFASTATNLVPGQSDVAGTWDLFLFNRASGTNVLVSHAPGSPTTSAGAGEQPGASQASSGGDWVVYHSWDAQLKPQIYLFRRSDSSVSLVSRSVSSPGQGGNQLSLSPRLTPDGAFVVFTSNSTDLVPGLAGPATYNVYLFDRVAGTLALASGAGGAGNVAANHVSAYPEVNDDGSVVAFYTWATDLVPGVADLNQTFDLALYDRGAAASVYATLHAPGQASATPSTRSTLVSASADGRYAVFLSAAANAVPGQVDRNGSQDVFLVDRTAGTTTLVSRAAGLPATTADGESFSAAISADGAYVAFVSRGRDHVAGQIDTNLEYNEYIGYIPGPDVFLYDRAAGTTALVSHAAGSSVTAGEYPCFSGLSLSADGRYVAFGCDADDLVAGQDDPNFEQDIFLYDRVAGTTVLVSRKAGTPATVADWYSDNPVISGDGRWVAFLSYATNLVAGSTDTNSQSDVFLFDRTTGQTLLVSRAAGTAATAGSQQSRDFALSPDGRYLAFSSFATNLVPGQNGSPTENVFLFDRATGVVELISRATGTSTTTVTGAWNPSVSDDGRYVAFRSYGSNLIPGQTAAIGPATANVFVHDRVTRQTELISRSILSPQKTSNGDAQKPTLSPDGRFLAFLSPATDLASGSTGRDIYLADRQLQTLERVAEGSGTYFTTTSTIPSTIPLLGPGGTVLFTSRGLSLVPGDWNGADDVFAWVRSGSGTGDFFTVNPCRLIDTRQAGQGPALVNGVPAVVDVHGVCGIPSTARAVAVNVTVFQAQGPGRLTLHPGNLSTPNTSTINFLAGQSLANNAILALASNGEGTLGFTPVVSGGGTVHLVVDVSGWFE